MNINNKLTELIDCVNSGDIDTLADLQRELIYLRSEIQALRIHDVVGRSEQLKALLEKLLNENMCSVVGDELIEEALKGF